MAIENIPEALDQIRRDEIARIRCGGLSADVGTTALSGAKQQDRPMFGETIEGTATSTTHQGRPVEIVESTML